jgi:hypothetical protein
MGWASGSQLAEELWKELKKMVPSMLHKKLAKLLYERFSDADADDWDTSATGLWATACPEKYKEYLNDE